MSPESFYPQSATQQLNAMYNRDARSPRSANHNPPQLPPPTRQSVPKFQRVTNTAELEPKVNAQPAFRRAAPDGGFISVSSSILCRPTVLTYSTAFTSVDDTSSFDVPDM